MLGTAKTNIHVSVAEQQQQQSLSDEHHYRRPQLEWLISVEPLQHHVPGLPRKHAEPVHIAAILGDDEEYHIHSHGTDSRSSEILGNVMVGEHVKRTSEEVEKALVEKLAHGSSSLPSEQTDEDSPDLWIRKALHILQAENILASFDVGEFMTFAHAYAASRKGGEAPAMVVYPRLDKDHEKKAQKSKLWTGYSTLPKVKPRNAIGGISAQGSGLM